MLSLLLLTLTTAFALFFIYMKAPLPMAALIVMQAFLISLSTYLTSNSPWFSFILFMIFLSAMMIIFIYVSSLAPNETLLIKNPKNLTWLMTTFFMFMIYLFMFTLNNPSIYDHSSFYTSTNENPILSCYKVYSLEISIMTVFLIIYLFIALIVVVKNSMNLTGPLRIKK